MARVYNADKTSYADYDENGRQTGAGLAGTENWASNPNSANIGNLPASSQALLGKSSGGSSNNTSTPASSPYQDQLTALKDAQLKASMAGLDKSKNASLSNLSAEKAKIEPAYQKEKMQAGVTAQQTAKSFSEYMAQRGGGAGASGIGGQGELLNNMAYQKQYGELGQAETGALTENARRVTDVGNAYNSDVQGANANVESQYLQNYITQMNADRAYQSQQDQFNKSYGLQEAGLTGNYQGNQTMQGAQSSASLALTNAQLKEMQDPNSVTNQMSRIGLDTAKLNFAELPAQLQSQAQQIAQDAQMGKITLQQAQINLDYLPRQMELGMAQTQAQISASNRSNTGGRGGSGSGGSSGSSGPSQTEYYNGLMNENSSTDGESLYKELQGNKDAYIQNMGTSNFNKAVKAAQDKYYDIVVDRWRGEYYALGGELQSKQDYYKGVLGMDNYNKLMNKAK